jgi:hypothetical protein
MPASQTATLSNPCNFEGEQWTMIHPLPRLGASSASMASSSSSDHRHQEDEGQTLLGFLGYVSKPPHHSEQEKGSRVQQQTKKWLHVS